jgi:beta-xylosidase
LPPPAGLRQLLDEPLRDPSICRGPEGIYYLTGTSEPFWDYNNESGIRVWRSGDLHQWEPLRTVWRYGGSPWHQKYLEARKPLWAPEIHYKKGTFWLTYSMPGWDGTARTSGSGLLRSTTGRPEGPYEDMHPDEPLGDEIDASLFEDSDGTLYFVWHCGKIAPLNADMNGFAEPYRQLKTVDTDPDPNHHSGLCAGIFGPDSFDHVGFEGAFIFKRNGLYYLDCSDNFDGRYSCAIAVSENLHGPYSSRYEAIPYGGHNVFFQDDAGQWWSTYFGTPWYERPAILPVAFDAEGRVRPVLCSPDSSKQRG